MTCNGNSTEWSPIQYGMIRVITKSDVRAAGVRFITSVITDRIGRHEVLSPINHKSTISEKRRIAKL